MIVRGPVITSCDMFCMYRGGLIIIGAPLKDNTIINIIYIINILCFFVNSFLIRLSSKTNGNRRIRAPGPNKNSSTRSGDHFALVKSKNGQV